MDFEVTYTEEQQRFRREVRAGLEAIVPPSVLRTPASTEDNYRRYLELRDLGRQLGAKGWLYPTAPAKYGGGGLDVDHAIILEEEVDRFDLSLPTKIFWPLMTYSSPSRTAVVMRTPARSEPAPGSVKSCQVRTSPR